jgi:hypothetical protein
MSIIISLIALTISAFTFWLTSIKKGIVKMTRPTIICFLEQNGIDGPKVFIRTLLYSTSNQGQYIQNMFVRLDRAETFQNFNVWFYGDTGTVKGSGLFVNKEGVSSYHHFLLPKDEAKYPFTAGEYSLKIFVETVDKMPKMISEQRLTLTDQQSIDLGQGKALYYDWASNAQNYFSHIDTKP